MNDETIEAIRLRLEAIFAVLARKLRGANLALSSSIGHTANNAFLLRAYLALKKHAQGDELAVIVDVRDVDGQLVIASNVGMDDGTIVAQGGVTEISISEDASTCAHAIDDWFLEFEEFLGTNEQTISEAAAKLT